MRQSDRNPKQSHTLFARIGTAIGLLLAIGLLGAVPASASYEQVATFADSGEGEQLLGSTAMAVNTTGAGGVPAGTVYAATGGRHSVVRYNPDGTFSEAWGWNVSVGGSNQFERCGPDGEAAHPACKAGGEKGSEGAGAGQFAVPRGIAVDQSTGNVYVANAVYEPVRPHNVIQVFSADGSQLIGGFGDAGVPFESIAEGPEKLHQIRESSLAVDESGVVYVSDRKGGTSESSEENRVMVFKPQTPGNYENYVYTGRSNDIEASGILALDSAGNLYSADVHETDIFKFALSEPDTPVCQFHLAAGGIRGMTVNPETGEPFYFSYKTGKVHQLSACNPEGKFVATSSFGPSPGTTQITGLAYNPNYAFPPSHPSGTLYAANQTSELINGRGHIFARAEAIPPSVESESVSSVSSSTATLGAQINPKGSETRYVFQYLTAAEYEANEPSDRFAGAAEAPLGGAVLGSGQKALSAATAVVGLVPDTEYRFRVVATSHCNSEDEEALCEDTGAGGIFRTFPAEAPNLPDNRAYELVSPTLKSGGEVFPLQPERSSCGIECKPGVEAQFFPRQSTPDGEAVVYEGQPFSITEGANVYNEYISKRTATGWQTTILAPKLMGSIGNGYKAFNASLSQGILQQGTPSLSLEAPSEVPNLYTQPSANPSALSALIGSEPPNRGTELQLAYAGASSDFSRQFFAANDALSGETAFAPEALDGGPGKKNLYESAGGELRLINVLPGNTETVPGAYFGGLPFYSSASNSRTSDLSHAISDDGSRVFWSDQAEQVYVRIDGEETIEIPDPGKFLSASADGSKVLLANGHIYDLQTEAITDLSAGQGGFQGIIGQSEDLSRIYFVDTAVLTGEEENQYGAKAQATKFNLYGWDEGTLSFIATLVENDNTVEGANGAWRLSPAQRTAEASPNGRWVTFLSQAALTGYDNVGPGCGVGAIGCNEVFLYDSASDELSCPSCNPSGQAPLGRSSLPLIPQRNTESPLPQPRYLTNEGRLYFDSRDSLTPFDTNDGVEDVYQHEPNGVGSCKRAIGCVNLISAGHEPIDSNFQAIDATGKNVFFTTRDQLVLKDRDELLDLYVAREGGGIAAETEVSRGECQGEACQPTTSAPNDPTPGSSTFEGAGNVDEKKAAKKKQKKAKKHKKKHAKKHAHKRAAKHNRGGAR
jgi:DNA-binding beta-propeller fold protein YncE